MSFLVLDVDLSILVRYETLEVVSGESEDSDLGVLAFTAFAKYLSMTQAVGIR